MKNDLTCAIVRDLLPSYIDKLTSRETGEQVEAHLCACEACRAIYGEMTDKEPPKAEVQEVDYLKKVRSSSRRLKRIALLAGCAVLILGVAAVMISKYYKDRTAAAAQTITILKGAEEELLKQLEQPQAHYDPDTRVLVVTGTGGYDQLALPPGHEKARTLDVQDDEFHLSVYIPVLQTDRMDLDTYLPAYIDRIDRGLNRIRACLKEQAREVYPADLAGKMVEISIRDENRYLYRNEEDRIFLNIGDFYWHVDELYLLALMDTDSVGWAQLGYVWYVGTCLDPYSEVVQMTEISPDMAYYDLCVKAGIRLKNLTCEDFRVLHDLISRICLDGGRIRWGWGSNYESMPLSKTRFCSGRAKTEAENSNMSVIMAVSFVGWLNDAYGFETVSDFAFGQKTFEKAFGTDFATAFAAWETYIVETYPTD